jgi:hypothetical protein
LFYPVNAARRSPKKVIPAHSNLDEHKRVFVPHNEVDLAEPATEVSLDQYEILLQQEPLRTLLCFLPVQSRIL